MWYRLKPFAFYALVLTSVAVEGATIPSFVDQQIAIGHAELHKGSSAAIAYARRLRDHQSESNVDAAWTCAVADWVEAAALVNANEAQRALVIDEHGLACLRAGLQPSNIAGELLIERGSALDSLGNVQGALSAYQRAYKIFNYVNNARGKALALQDLAAIYVTAGDNKTALSYVQQLLDIFSSDHLLNSAALNNAGIAFSQMHRLSEADEEYKKAIAEALKANNLPFALRILGNLARTQVEEGKLEQADLTISKALAISNEKALYEVRPMLYGVLAQSALKKGALGLASYYVGQSLKKENGPQSSTLLRDYNLTAYNIYARLGDTAKALKHLEAFKALDDQARALTASASAALMSARFDFANQNLKIAQLRAGRAEQDAVLAHTRARYQNTLFTGLFIATVLVSVLLFIGFVSISRSRNQVRAANRDLQRSNTDLAKALAAKGEFLATTSHEIRTPLNGILGMTQVVLADGAVPPPLRERVELIHRAGETMRTLVDDILDMAKMETGELRIHPAPADLPRLLGEIGTIWTDRAAAKEIALVIDLAACPEGVVVDEVRLRQIVGNLVSNAIKFTDRGQVAVSAWAEPQAQGEALLIRVADSGIGIPADRLADIFESFRQVDGGVTRRHGGTGLGLAICRNLARAMGGDVAVDSVLGAGSTFTLSLPLERVDLTPVRAVAPAAAATLGEARLLVLEPNPLAQGILRAVLAGQAAAVEVVADIAAAERVLSAGGIHHLLADGAAWGLDAAAAVRFAAASGVPRTTLLWPAPGPEVTALVAEARGVRLLAKPIGPVDLLAGLRMGYTDGAMGRDLAA